MAQWKRAGPITQRSEDQNLAMLKGFFFILYGHDLKPTLFVNSISNLSDSHLSRVTFFFFNVRGRKNVFAFFSNEKEHYSYVFHYIKYLADLAM